MKRSTDRTLTTSVGSLARPHYLLETMREKEHGEPYDQNVFAQQIREAVAEVVRRQVACGLDVVTDGEQGKVSFKRLCLLPRPRFWSAMSITGPTRSSRRR